VGKEKEKREAASVMGKKKATLVHSTGQQPLPQQSLEAPTPVKRDDSGEKKLHKAEEKKARKEEERQQRRRARIQKLFTKADKDESGFLDVPEVAKLIQGAFKKKDLERLGDLTLEKFAERQVKKYDASGNGRLEFSEFLHLYEELLEDPKLPDDLRASAIEADDEEQ